ncbi:MAG: hypothetical protein R2729_08800 [Bryobacteraceae bacterium]
MALIEGFRVQNYKVLKDITLGRLWNQQKTGSRVPKSCDGKGQASQIFVTTHQPYFVDALSPKETWVLEKGKDGFSTIRRASDDPVVQSMVDQDLPLGSLWHSDYLDSRIQ